MSAPLPDADFNTLLRDYLLNKKQLTKEQQQRAVRLQDETQTPYHQLLLQLGFIREQDLAEAFSTLLDLPLASKVHYENSMEIPDSINIEFLMAQQAIVLSHDDDHYQVAMSSPQDRYILQALQLALNHNIHPVVGTASDILAALALKHELPETSGDMPFDEQDTNLDDIEQLRDMASEAPVIRLVNQLLTQALKLKASDIHFEPYESTLVVRYRIDGLLRTIETSNNTPAAAVISRIKVMAHLDIAERRLPQDGRIKLRIDGRGIDIRISTVPTLHGESLVLRLLDQEAVRLDFEALGFSQVSLDKIQRLLALPHGILLVTGPTGSGKTTTLYTALEQLNTPDKKILTVEDPIEYHLEGINQIQVQSNIALTFATALRSILRQDPDIIMIGEMRDTETARIAIQAALTGHKVFSTLHTNDAPSSLTRLIDMEIDRFLITSTVNGVIAQRLVRKLCTDCRQAYLADKSLHNILSQHHPITTKDLTLYQAGACEQCDHTGYKGRTTLCEVLEIDESLRDVIHQQSDAESLKAAAKKSGMETLLSDGYRKVIDGVTSWEEIERVAQSNDA